MFTRNLALFLFYLIAISGCAGSNAPVGWLPSLDEIKKESYGGWMTIIVIPDSLKDNDAYLQYGGEYISSDTNNVYLLADSLFIIPIIDIDESILELDDKNTGAYGLWTFGGIVVSIATHGKYFGLTFPMWLSMGIPSTTGESLRDRYEYERGSSELTYWNNIQKFARFPQGINGINLKELLPKNINQSSEDTLQVVEYYK